MLRLRRAHAAGGAADNGRTSFAVYWGSATAGRKAVLSCFILLCLFNVALPKGGIKWQDLPVTWGYVFLFILAVPAGIGLIRRSRPLTMPLVHFSLFCLPVALLIVFKWFVYGLPASQTLIYLMQFLLLPFVMLVIVSHYLEDVPSDVLGLLLVWCIRFTIAWGIMNFLLYPVIKDVFQIPYVTVNAADYGEIIGKNNRRGELMKLMSTYNNGNLYGDCMVLLAPVYLLYERSRTWITLFIVALICTLSRTVWFSTVAVAGCMMMVGQINVRRVGLWLGVIIAIGLIVVMLPLIGWSPDDLFRTDLGGRLGTLWSLELSVFGGATMRIPELTYFGFLNSFGIIGFPFAVGCLAAGPIYGAVHFRRLSPLRRAALAGACSYMFAAILDGAFVFPPTMVLFFFVTGLIYRRGLRPGTKAGLAVRAPVHGARVMGHGLRP